jgi:hypothetical protein
MMRRSRGQNGIRLAQTTVRFLKTLQESRHCARTDGDMASDFHIPLTQLAGNNADAFFAFEVFRPKQ